MVVDANGGYIHFFFCRCLLLLQWFKQLGKARMLTVRDLLSWVQFINVTRGGLGLDYALLHGLFLILLDGLSLGNPCFYMLTIFLYT